MLEDYFRQYALVFVFSVVAVVVPASVLMVGYLAQVLGVSPSTPNPVMNDTYECGMEMARTKWGQFNFRYYMYALLFVIFDVEVVFIYPWAVKFNQLGLFALVEMFVFIGILVVGWLYAWRKRDLEWR